MEILYTGTLTVRGENTKSEVLSLARMLGMDLNNFFIEELPTVSYPFPFNGFRPVAINHLYKKAGEDETPVKKKRGRPRKIRTEEDSEPKVKVKKSRKSCSVSEEAAVDRDSSPELFYQVTNPTFTIKPAEKNKLKKIGRKLKTYREQSPPLDIPEISLTFDLGGERDRTINLHQLTDRKQMESQARNINISGEISANNHQVMKETNNGTIAKERVPLDNHIMIIVVAQR